MAEPTAPLLLIERYVDRIDVKFVIVADQCFVFLFSKNPRYLQEYSKYLLMSLLVKLRNNGWHITEDAFDELSEGKKLESVDSIIKKAINADLSEYGSKCIPEDLNRGKLENIEGNVVLQIQNIRNIAVPKSSEKDMFDSANGHKFLKVQLTDGVNRCFALELSSIHNLSVDVPPGTKIYLKPGKISVKQGFILLDNSVCKLLGGRVPNLVEKWELNRSIAKSMRSRQGGQDGSGPPPWVPFGQNISSNVDTKGKSLSVSNNDVQAKDSTGFDEQRKAVIAEAMKAKSGTQKKMFATTANKNQGEGKVKENIHNFGSHTHASSYGARNSSKFKNDGETPGQNQRRGNSMYRDLDSKEEGSSEASSRPSGPSTLFDFLNLKMSIDDDNENNEKSNDARSSNVEKRFNDIKQRYSRENSYRHSNKADTFKGNRRQNDSRNFQSAKNEFPNRSDNQYRHYDNNKRSNHHQRNYDDGYQKSNYSQQYPTLASSAGTGHYQGNSYTQHTFSNEYYAPDNVGNMERYDQSSGHNQANSHGRTFYNTNSTRHQNNRYRRAGNNDQTHTSYNRPDRLMNQY